MTVVADVVARFRGDFTDLTSGAQGAADAVDKIGKGSGGLTSVSSQASEAGNAASDMADKFGVAGGVLDELGKKGDSVGASLKGMLFGVTGAAGIGGLIAVAKSATEELQTLGVQFNSTFGQSGGAQLQSAISQADKLGVSIAAAGTAYQEFGIATKGSTQNLSADMKIFNDIAAGTGSTLDSVAGSISNYYQLIQRQGGSGGSASRFATSLLEQHIIDPQTYNQLRLQANQGANPQQLLDTILKNGESQYKGAGTAQANTLSGQLQTFKNQFSEGSAGALSPLMGELQNGLKALNQGMATSGFKEIIKDVQGFVAAIAQGVAILAPFAKFLVELGLGAANFASSIGVAKPVIEAVVVALLAWKAVDIIGSIGQTVSKLGAQSAAEKEVAASTDMATAAILNQAKALEILNAEGTRIGSVVPMAGEAPAAAAAPSIAQRGRNFFGGGTGYLIGGAALAVGSNFAGDAIGGTAGSATKSIGSDAGVGMALGGMIGPEGAGIGAALGAVVGVVQSHFKNAADAAQSFAESVKNLTNGWNVNHPIDLNTAQNSLGIDGKYGKTQADLVHSATIAATQSVADVSGMVKTEMKGNSTWNSGQVGRNFAQGIPGVGLAESFIPGLSQYINTNATVAGQVAGWVAGGATGGDTHTMTAAERRSMTAANDNLKKDRGAEYNANQNLGFIEKSTGLNAGDAAQFAVKNNIDITQNISKNAQALETSTLKLNSLGGAAQFAAEALANKLGYVASLTTGQYGQQTQNLQGTLSAQGTSLKDVLALSAKAGIDPSQYLAYNSSLVNTAAGSLTPQQAAQLRSAAPTSVGQAAGMTSITAQQAQTLNAPIQAVQQLTDSDHALTEAQDAVEQSGWAVKDAVFAQSQAIFQASQATFAYDQAVNQNAWGLQTQRDAMAAVTSVLTSGYLPANWNLATTLQQTTSLTNEQVSSIIAISDAYVAAEAAMYGYNSAGQSLFTTYTQLSGNVQQLQDDEGKYSNILQYTLAGTKQMNQALQDEKLASSQTSAAMATAELQGYGSNSGLMLTLKKTAANQQAQNTITQNYQTQGIGNQQFNISQAQLAPDKAYQAMYDAAKNIGALQGPLLDAKQALADLKPAYDAANTTLQIATKRNQDMTAAVSDLAGADQSAVTNANNLKVAQQGQAAAAQGVYDAANAVKSAQLGQRDAGWALQDATWSNASAINTFAGDLSTAVSSWLSTLNGYVTNVGVAGVTMAQQWMQQQNFMANYFTEITRRDASTGSTSKAYGELAAGYWNLVGQTANGPVDAAAIAEALKKGMYDLSAVPKFDSGGGIAKSGLAVVHAGEYVVPAGGALIGDNSKLIAALQAQQTITSAQGTVGTGSQQMQIQQGAVQVLIDLSNTGYSSDSALVLEIQKQINEAFSRVAQEIANH